MSKKNLFFIKKKYKFIYFETSKFWFIEHVFYKSVCPQIIHASHREKKIKYIGADIGRGHYNFISGLPPGTRNPYSKTFFYTWQPFIFKKPKDKIYWRRHWAWSL
jgi:hypothetical protein